MFLYLKNQFEQVLHGGVEIVFSKFTKIIKIFLANLLAFSFLPLSFFIKILSKYIVIRFAEIPSNRIGHFAMETDLYLTKKKLNKSKCIDIFSVQYYDNYICNKKLYDCFKKKIIILPSFFIYPFILNSKYYKIFSNQSFQLNNSNDRDVGNILRKTNQNIILDQSDIKIGDEFLYKISSLGPKIKFAIIIIRDSEYLSKKFNKNWAYHDYRDGKINDYVLACEELTKHGYYVFRMGEIVKKKIKTKNPMIIDYATNGMRTELLDIYLAAKCDFCISNITGYDSVPAIFRKPMLYTNTTILGHLPTFYEKYLITIRHHYSKKLNRRLSLTEIFEQNVFALFKTSEFLSKGIILKDNSPEEIRDAAIEMVELITDPTKKNCKYNKVFWDIYKSCIVKNNLQANHGLLLSKISTKFLKKNNYLIK